MKLIRWYQYASTCTPLQCTVCGDTALVLREGDGWSFADGTENATFEGNYCNLCTRTLLASGAAVMDRDELETLP